MILKFGMIMPFHYFKYLWNIWLKKLDNYYNAELAFQHILKIDSDFHAKGYIQVYMAII